MYIQIISDNNNWVTGLLNQEFFFGAKVYDIGSQFGINNGRVSKLIISKDENLSLYNAIANYDRGWDIEPKSRKEQLALNAIIQCLEDLPKRH